MSLATKQLRVAYLIGRADTIGGTQRHVLDLARGMSDRGHSVRVFTGPRGAFSEELEAAGVFTTEIPDLDCASMLSPHRDARAVLALRKLLNDFAPDLLTIHSSKGGIVGRLGAKSVGVPTVYTLHGASFGPGIPTLRRLAARVVETLLRPLTDEVIAVSESDRRLAVDKRIIDGTSIRTILNGVPDRHSPTLPAGSGRSTTRMIMIARLAPQKDHELLLRTLADTEGLGPWHLTLVGDGELTDHVERLVADLGIGDRVTFTGLVSSADPLLDEADLSVLISHYEGLPVAIVEANRAGRPTLASDVGGISEVVKQGCSGWLVPEGDRVGLARALREALDPETDLQLLGRNARAGYEELLEFESFVSATEMVYEKAARKRGGS